MVDSRWQGDTGIGRMYSEIMHGKPSGIQLESLNDNFPLGSFWSPVRLAKAISKKPDCRLFYSPSFMPPLWSRIPYIITIHDLMHLFYYSYAHRLYYKSLIAPLARKAATVITVSRFSKGQLMDLLNVREDRIQVIYNGVDQRFFSGAEQHSLEGRPYFLYVGNRRPNKNLPNMLRAFAASGVPEDFLFALSGSPDAEVLALCNTLGITERIRFLGFIEEERLPALYRGAWATCYVSLMEGFGLPLLESMAVGTPVITSDTSSLPEVAGGAALTVNPESTEAIASAMRQMVDDPILRDKLIASGIQRAGMFSWENTRRETWKTIKRHI